MVSNEYDGDDGDGDHGGGGDDGGNDGDVCEESNQLGRNPKSGGGDDNDGDYDGNRGYLTKS